ncbi:unnamed protein product, partial [Tetraodon nigroviridis]
LLSRHVSTTLRPPTTLWNPASLIETATDSRRNHEPSGMGHYDLARLAPGTSKYEDGVRRREGGPVEKYAPLRCPPGLPEPSTFLADLEKSTQSFLSQQRASLSLSSQYEHIQGLGAGPGGAQVAPLGPGPDAMLIYDEILQQHRRPVSKLDLEEKRKREAREKGYYYELDDSYDESDEEEVRAHLRRVAEQPPLKLDDSTEVRAASRRSRASSRSGTPHHTALLLPPETGLSSSGRSDHREPAG